MTKPINTIIVLGIVMVGIAGSMILSQGFQDTAGGLKGDITTSMPTTWTCADKCVPTCAGVGHSPLTEAETIQCAQICGHPNTAVPPCSPPCPTSNPYCAQCPAKVKLVSVPLPADTAAPGNVPPGTWTYNWTAVGNSIDATKERLRQVVFDACNNMVDWSLPANKPPPCDNFCNEGTLTKEVHNFTVSNSRCIMGSGMPTMTTCWVKLDRTATKCKAVRQCNKKLT